MALVGTSAEDGGRRRDNGSGVGGVSQSRHDGVGTNDGALFQGFEMLSYASYLFLWQRLQTNPEIANELDTVV